MTDSADMVQRHPKPEPSGDIVGLLPCPFCGHSADIERVGDRRRSTIYQCDSCGCSLETGEEWSHGRQWNERSDAAVKALEAKLSLIEAELATSLALLARVDQLGKTGGWKRLPDGSAFSATPLASEIAAAILRISTERR